MLLKYCRISHAVCSCSRFQTSVDQRPHPVTGALSLYEKRLQVPGRPLPFLVVKVSPQSHKAHCRTTDTGTETMALSTATQQLKRATQTALKQNVPVQTDLPWDPLEILSLQRISVCTQHIYTTTPFQTSYQNEVNFYPLTFPCRLGRSPPGPCASRVSHGEQTGPAATASCPAPP